MIEGEGPGGRALTELINIGSRMVVLEDKSASKPATSKWLLRPHVPLNHLRKHQLEPTRGDLINPAGGEERHGMQ